MYVDIKAGVMTPYDATPTGSFNVFALGGWAGGRGANRFRKQTRVLPCLRREPTRELTLIEKILFFFLSIEESI